jgi:putative ABC transport system permease protein
MCLVIRTAPGQIASVTSAVRTAIHSVAPEQPIERVTTLDQVAADSIADRRFDVAVVMAFSAIGLLLAIVGLAGVVGRSIVERVREIAVRAALGADSRHLQSMMVGQALRPALGGLACGAVLSWWLTTRLQTQLLEVRAHDPLTFVDGCLLLTGVTTLAAYLPARAATSVDPMDALRAE